MADWVYEKSTAEIGKARVTVEHNEDSDTFWSWNVVHPNGVASGSCQSFENAQERAVKIANCFNKEM